MLFWICPECGRECSPAIRECPTCALPPSTEPPPTPRAPVAAEPEPIQQTAEIKPVGHAPLPKTTGYRIETGHQLMSLAETFQSGPYAALLTPGRQQQLLAGATATSALALEEEPEEPELPEPELSNSLAILDAPAFKPAKPGRAVQMKFSPEPVPVRVSSPALSSAPAPTPVDYSLALADGVKPGQVRFQAVDMPAGEAIQPAAEPLPSNRRSVAFLRQEPRKSNQRTPTVPDPAGLAAEPGASSLKPAALRNRTVADSKAGQSEDISDHNDVARGPLRFEAVKPSLVSSDLNVTGESLADLQKALEISAEEQEQVAIGAIQATFQEQPALSLLSAPAEIVTAPAPPASQWMRSENPKFKAAPPPNNGPGAVAAGPRATTLAGPCLPPQLLNLDLRNSCLNPRRRRSSWLLTLFAVAIVILGAVSVGNYLTQNRDVTVPSLAAPVRAIKSAASPMRVLQEHPAAKSVEVAGVRVVTGANKKPQLEYIVINHSANELTGLNIRITVRPADGQSDTPLFNVSNLVATLGPNQSREVRTDLDPSVAADSLTDWRSLRTEIFIAR